MIILPELSIFHSPSRVTILRAMFETIAAQIDTAAAKLTHLRRFL